MKHICIQILKNIVSVIMFLFLVLWLVPSFLFMIIKRYFQEILNLIQGKPTCFPKIPYIEVVSDVKKGTKEYFKMKLVEQMVAVVCVVVASSFIHNKWKIVRTTKISIQSS